MISLEEKRILGESGVAGVADGYLLDGSLLATTYAPLVREHYLPHAVMLLGGAPNMAELLKYVLTYPTAVEQGVLHGWYCTRLDDGDQAAWTLRAEGAEGDVKLAEYLVAQHNKREFSGCNDYFGSVVAREVLVPVADLRDPVGYGGLSFSQAASLVGGGGEGTAMEEEEGYCYLAAFQSKYHALFSRVLGKGISFEYFLALWSGCRLCGMITATPMVVTGSAEEAHVSVATVDCSEEAYGKNRGPTVIPELGCVGYGDRSCSTGGSGFVPCRACTGKLKWNRGRYTCCPSAETIEAEADDLLARRALIDPDNVWAIRFAYAEKVGVDHKKLKRDVQYVVTPCHDEILGTVLAFSGGYIEIVIPPGVLWEGPSGVSLRADKWTTVMASDQICLRLPDLKSHSMKFMVRCRGYTGWIRWHHKYARVDPSDSSSRFAERHVRAKVVVYSGPDTTKAKVLPDSESDGAAVAVRNISGYVDCDMHDGKVISRDRDSNLPYGLARMGKGAWKLEPRKYGVGVTPAGLLGKFVGVASVGGMKFSGTAWFSQRCKGAVLVVGGSGADAVVCDDEYFLDDGGPDEDGEGIYSFGDAYL